MGFWSGCRILLVITSLFGQIGLAQTVAAPLTVGIKEAKPFSFQDASGTWRGISVVLWEGIAEDIGLDFSYEERDLAGLLAGLEDKSLDLVVGALTVTAAREAVFNFSHSFYQTGLGVATRQGTNRGLIYSIGQILRADFFKILAIILLALLVATVLIRYFEYRLVLSHPDKEGKARNQMGESLWWTLVILIGKNDSHPVSLGGRVIALLWMVASLFIVSSLTAIITSALTVSNLQSSVESIEDLKRLRVASVQSSSSASYLRDQLVGFVERATLDEALIMLERGETDAVVYDRPLLRYLINESYAESLQVTSLVLAPQSYALATPQDSPWLEQINLHLLERINEESWQRLLYSFLGE